MDDGKCKCIQLYDGWSVSCAAVGVITTCWFPTAVRRLRNQIDDIKMLKLHFCFTLQLKFSIIKALSSNIATQVMYMDSGMLKFGLAAQSIFKDKSHDSLSVMSMSLIAAKLSFYCVLALMGFRYWRTVKQPFKFINTLNPLSETKWVSEITREKCDQ